MIKLDISKVNKNTVYVTRNGNEVKLIDYIPNTIKTNRLLFLLKGTDPETDKVLGCDEEGRCYTVNGYEASYTETSYYDYDIFMDTKIKGYINIIKNDDWYVCSNLYKTEQDALNKASKDVFKTVKVEFDDE